MDIKGNDNARTILHSCNQAWSQSIQQPCREARDRSTKSAYGQIAGHTLRDNSPTMAERLHHSCLGTFRNLVTPAGIASPLCRLSFRLQHKGNPVSSPLNPDAHVIFHNPEPHATAFAELPLSQWPLMTAPINNGLLIGRPNKQRPRVVLGARATAAKVRDKSP